MRKHVPSVPSAAVRAAEQLLLTVGRSYPGLLRTTARPQGRLEVGALDELQPLPAHLVRNEGQASHVTAGLDKLGTRPSLIGSPTRVITIGIVEVAFFAV